LNNKLASLPNYQTLKTLFKLFNGIALLGWATIIGMPFWEDGSTFVAYVVVSLLALIYAYLLYSSFKVKPESGADRPSFFNIRGVIALFQNPVAILVAWVHILAFDLMAAVYIQQEGSLLDMSHWLLIPCYLLTLMFGPLGLLLFFAMSLFVA
jgi:Mg2+/Co2+ transporter CorB